MLNRRFASVFLTTPAHGKPADKATYCAKGAYKRCCRDARKRIMYGAVRTGKHVFVLIRGSAVPNRCVKLHPSLYEVVKTNRFLSLEATSVQDI